MHGHDALSALFEDLEQQAEGLALAERDAELGDRIRAEYAMVTWVARLHASLGARVRLSTAGVGALDGALVRVGDGWCLVETSPVSQEWLVLLHAVTRASGLSDRAVSAEARSVADRLSVRSALRGLAEARTVVVLHDVDGTRMRGRLGRVGADFVELSLESGEPADEPWQPAAAVVPLARLAAVRCG